MGNLAFISSKRNLDPRGVTALLERINAEFFDNLWSIDQKVAPECWRFSYAAAIPRIGRPQEMKVYDHPFWEFWLRPSKRKLSSNHPRPGVQWVYWSWNIIQNECTREWGGRLSDEGVEGTWAPKPFRTFEQYLDEYYDHFEDNHELQKELVERERSYLPEAFAALGRKEVKPA